MKTILKIILSIFVVVNFFACDKVNQPVIVVSEVDTSLYPGIFYDYIPPSFDVNINTERNVLLEDFTGHQCSFCPPAADKAKALEASNPGRIFSVAIHAAPNASGSGGFQAVKTSGNKFKRDFTTPEGKGIASHLFSIFGGSSNPVGNVNRVEPIFSPHAQWGPLTDSILNTPLIANIQVKSSFFPSTRGVYLHTQVEFVSDANGEFAVVIYAIDNEIIDWQKKVGSPDVEDYKHHNVHIGNVFEGETFGRTFVNGAVSTGEKFEKDFSYQLSADLPKEDMHFLIFVVDKGTEEILHVVKHEI